MRWLRIFRHWNREFSATGARYFQSRNVAEIHVQYLSLRHVVSSNPRSTNTKMWHQMEQARSGPQKIDLLITIYFHLPDGFGGRRFMKRIGQSRFVLESDPFCPSCRFSAKTRFAVVFEEANQSVLPQPRLPDA